VLQKLQRTSVWLTSARRKPCTDRPFSFCPDVYNRITHSSTAFESETIFACGAANSVESKLKSEKSYAYIYNNKLSGLYNAIQVNFFGGWRQIEAQH